MRKNGFFAMLTRMRHITRWGLMRNNIRENLTEHSFDTAVTAHALAVIGRERFGRDIDPGQIAAVALFHDAGEIITGDLPTPVKYQSEQLRGAYRSIEDIAAEKLTAMLPEDMQDEFRPYLYGGSDYAHQLVKAADKISAYVKCLEEERAGNHEFNAAGESIRRTIEQIDMPEVQDFVRTFVPSFKLTLDELNNPGGAQ